MEFMNSFILEIIIVNIGIVLCFCIGHAAHRKLIEDALSSDRKDTINIIFIIVYSAIIFTDIWFTALWICKMYGVA